MSAATAAPTLVLECYECNDEIRSPTPLDWFLWDDNTVRPMCSECMSERTRGDIRVKTMMYRKAAHHAKPVALVTSPSLPPQSFASSAQR